MKKTIILSCTFDPLKDGGKPTTTLQNFFNSVNKEIQSAEFMSVQWLQSSGADQGYLKVTLTAIITKHD